MCVCVCVLCVCVCMCECVCVYVEDTSIVSIILFKIMDSIELCNSEISYDLTKEDRMSRSRLDAHRFSE